MVHCARCDKALMQSTHTPVFALQVKKVGKYEIGKTLGEGTFGKVKYAVNTETGEKVRRVTHRCAACRAVVSREHTPLGRT